MDVDVRLLYLWLALVDEEAQLVVELVDQLEHVEELRALGLVGTQLECFLVLYHRCLEVVQLGVYYTQHLVYLCNLARVLTILLFSQLEGFLEDLQSFWELTLKLVKNTDVIEAVSSKLPSNIG